MQIHGGWVFGYISTVLTAMSGGDPQGKVRNAGSWGVREQRISDSQRAVMNGSGITGHQQLGGRWSPDPLWQPATLARPLPHSPRPPPVSSTCGKVEVASVTPKSLFIWVDVFMCDHLFWSFILIWSQKSFVFQNSVIHIRAYSHSDTTQEKLFLNSTYFNVASICVNAFLLRRLECWDFGAFLSRSMLKKVENIWPFANPQTDRLAPSVVGEQMCKVLSDVMLNSEHILCKSQKQSSAVNWLLTEAVELLCTGSKQKSSCYKSNN